MQINESTLVVHKIITIIYDSKLNKMTVEWNSNPKVDLVADTVLSIIIMAENSPSAIKVNYVNINRY